MNPVRREPLVAIIGPGEAEPFLVSLAEELGRGVANMGVTVLTGGRGGVMAAASKGAKEAGGRTVGILPGTAMSPLNPYLDVAILTNLGHARNAVIAQTADAVLAVGGGYGTLSEIGLALRQNKVVVGLASWEIPGVHAVATPAEALNAIAEALAGLGVL